MNYFFRGSLEITPPNEYVYSIIDGSAATQEFKKIKVMVKNSTPDTIAGEEMLDGTIQAVAKYKVRPNYVDDLSNDPPTQAEMQGVEISYSVSSPQTITSLSSSTPEEFTFDFIGDPIPVGITDLYLQVVFKGTLGNETDIAVAVGMMDLNEPQHLTFWNDTDYFLLDEIPRKAEDIENDPGVGNYGYIYPYDFTETIGFSGHPLVNPPAVISISLLPPARYSHIIILTDNPDGYYVTDHVEAYLDAIPIINDTWNYSMPGTVNQEETDGTFTSTPVYSVRGIRQHQRTYLMNYYPTFIYINSLPASPQNDLGPYPAFINFPN